MARHGSDFSRLHLVTTTYAHISQHLGALPALTNGRGDREGMRAAQQAPGAWRRTIWTGWHGRGRPRSPLPARERLPKAYGDSHA